MAALDARAGGYRTVIDSAEHLLGVLPKGEDRIDIAVDDLCHAVDELGASSPVGRQGFEAAPGSTAEPVPLDAALNEAAAQARVAQLLFAASAAVDEEKAGSDGSGALRATVAAARTDLAAPPPAAQRFEAAAGAGVGLAEAVEALRRDANAALDLLVTECERTTTAALAVLGSYKDTMLESLGAIAKQLEASLPTLTPVFKLVARAWKWLLKSVTSLEAIADQLPIEELKAKLKPILELAQPRTAIERVLNVADARAEIVAWRLDAPLEVETVAGARASLSALGERFTTAAGNARLIQGILAGIAGLIALKLSGPMAPLVMPSVHVLIVASVVVLAIDYADANATVNFVKGIRQVGRELGQPTDATHRQRA